MGTRDENIFMAKIAEMAERYDDMVHYMTAVAHLPTELQVDERNMLSVAFKNSVGARRQAWRVVNSLQNQQQASNPAVASMIAGYRGEVEDELKKKCEDIIKILNHNLIPSASTVSAQVFYLKMCGDYFRYLAEFSASSDAPKASAADSYKQALEIAQGLKATDPIRLGLALNFSVFYYEVFGAPAKACTLAKEAFDEASKMMTSLTEEECQDSFQIMQLLQDNLKLWTSDMPQGGQDGTVMEDFD